MNPSVSASSAPQNVLIVDDHPRMRQFIGTLLPPPLQARECTDGSKALDAYKEHKPFCVLMDIAMPNVNGLAAATAIRKFDPSARIIFVSQFSDAETKSAAKAAGGSAFLLKENLNELSALLQRLAEKPSGPQNL